MDAFRRDVANFNGVEDMPLSQDDLNKISVIVQEWSPSAVTAGTIDWGKKDSAGNPIKESVAQQAADNAKAIADLTKKVDALAAKVGTGTSGGSPLPTEFDLSSMARAVADELDRRARDSDPKTGPTS